MKHTAVSKEYAELKESPADETEEAGKQREEKLAKKMKQVKAVRAETINFREYPPTFRMDAHGWVWLLLRSGT